MSQAPLIESSGARYLGPAIALLRWVGVATMLLIVLAWPHAGRGDQSLWPYVGAFAVYNGLVSLLQRAVPRLRSWRWVPGLDLPVAAVLFYLDFEPGGPLFLSFFLGVATAALSWPLRFALLYTAVAGVVVVAVATTLPGWTVSPPDLRQLAARIAVLSGVGVGTALLRRQVEREAAIAQARHDEAARLKALEQVRAAFFASVSHDLKTPLTAVQAALGALEASGGDRLLPEERDLLANARRNAGRIRLQIDDLLTARQIDSGTLQLERVPLDLRAIAGDAISVVHYSMQEKAQDVTVDLPTPLPVVGDARRLEQVIVNLLDNAHRHTPHGSRVTVTGQLTGDEVHLVVADNGPGIPPEHHEQIFEPSYRRGESRGSGLGLAVARDVIALHGGRLWVTSQPGEGAAFHIALPAAGQSAVA